MYKLKSADDYWRDYQLGQGSADHTARQVFKEVVQPLLDNIADIGREKANLRIVIKGLMKRLARREWVNVGDRLPDCLSIQYIGPTKNAAQRWRTEYEQYVVIPGGSVHADATYWMPLNPPQTATHQTTARPST